MAAADDQIWVRTFVYDTGIGERNSRLLPIEFNDSVSRGAPLLEGAVALRIGGVEVLSTELVGVGYVEDWWYAALEAIGPLLRLRSADWMLPGKVCRVRFDVLSGTRRTGVQTVLGDGSSLSVRAEVRVQSIVEAMLDEADRFFRWRPFGAHEDALERVRTLRTASAPWKTR